ncbi:MAG: D-alanyl-D-alanine carboxypeptidase [Alphaproteobacteria bacterium]|nr:D-alanyl-D-alanine carboxypeptidase [Alphaproteobacteria bacterium]
MASPAAHAARIGTAPSGPVYEALALDAETGQVLRALNPDAITYPASLTKMMTLYLTFEALNQGRLRVDQYLTVSPAAAAHAPSRLGLQPGEVVMVRDLILGIVTKSANDAAAVLAEALGGSEPSFAQLMTEKAHQLGMLHTNYANASGLPDPAQLTTARDVARLALALYHDFPREYRYFSVKEFNFQGELVTGHDHMLDWYPGADGIKTGFTVASGYNLATSAVQNGRRLIGVILGGRSVRSRDVAMGQLLDLGFADLAQQPQTLVAQRQVPAVPAVAATAPAAQPAGATPAHPTLADVAAAALAAPAQPAAPQPPAAAAMAQPPAPAAAPASSLADVASAAIRHLTPVGKAEAAESAENWGIQLGGFRGEAAAARAEHEIGRLAFARGKEAQILAPAGGDRLYRLRLLRFSPQAARAACDELHRQRQACTVMMPVGLKVAAAH